MRFSDAVVRPESEEEVEAARSIVPFKVDRIQGFGFEGTLLGFL